MNHTEKSIKDLLAMYKVESDKAKSFSDGKDHIELEIRLRGVDREVFEAIFTSIKQNPDFTNGELETSINIISENIYERGQNVDKNSYIRTIKFVNGKTTDDTYHKKLRLIRPVAIDDYIKYSVGLSKESTNVKFNSSSNAQVRFKVRASFEYTANNNVWRFDLTAVKQGTIADLGPHLTSIRDSLFIPQLSIDNFLSELNFNQIDKYEIEIEHMSGNLQRDDLNVIKRIFDMINPQYASDMLYREEIYEIAKYIEPHKLDLFASSQRNFGLKQLANQAMALTKGTYYEKIYPANGYLATIKADGERCLVVLNGNRFRIISSIVETIVHGVVELGSITITDCELLKKQSSIVLRVFDVLVLNGKGVHNQGMEDRIKYIPEAVAVMNNSLQLYSQKDGLQGINEKIINEKIINEKIVNEKVITAIPAIYTILDQSNLEAGYREVYDNAVMKYDFPFDGLMMSEPGYNYRETHNYKWKPYEHQTIDFLAVKCPQKLLGIKPYVKVMDRELYLLFVGIDQTVRDQLGISFIPHYKQIFDVPGGYFPIQFSPSSNPYAYLYYHKVVNTSNNNVMSNNPMSNNPMSNNSNIDKKIIELGRDRSNTEWIFHRIREDRKMSQNYYGNDFKVAELTYSNYIDPFEFNELWEKNAGYFDKTLLGTHFAPNKFKRFVISLLLRDNLSDSKWIIDEAAGRGADTHRYQEIGTEHALFIDIDSSAIAELISRKFSYLNAKKRGVRSLISSDTSSKTIVKAYDTVHGQEYDKVITKHLKAMTIHTLVADLKEPAVDLMAKTYQFGLNPGIADGIICNFALHYMCDQIENLRNLLIFNHKMLKSGGLFMFTVMDGEKIFKLLTDYEYGSTWELRENGVLKYALRRDYKGTKLATVGQMISVLLPFSTEMKPEPLCNIDVVISEAKKVGFAVELNASMSTYMQKFEKLDRGLYAQLTADDKEYISLYKYVSLRKV